ncbi:MAG: SHOCT domain-containing protein [Deltaproteobacteria bacterium]|nr:SHOCT domain-containing protein [Deltaproteobacteria bacterium]
MNARTPMRLSRRFAVVAICLSGLALAACSKAGFQTSDVYRKGKDAIVLTWETDANGRVVPKGFSHPATVEPAKLAAILADLTYSEHAFFKWRERDRVFDEDEVKKLAKSMAKALSTCNADQWVGFDVTSYKRDLVFKSRKLTSGWAWVKDDRLHLVLGNFLFELSNEDQPYSGDPRARYSLGTFRLDPGPHNAPPAIVADDPYLKKEHTNWTVVTLTNWAPKPRPEEDEDDAGTTPPSTPPAPVPAAAPPPTPAEPAAPPPAETRSVEERLQELKALLDKGLITPEEYEKKRAEILGAI